MVCFVSFGMAEEESQSIGSKIYDTAKQLASSKEVQAVVAGVTGGAATVAAIPAAVSAAGFGVGGIGAGTIGASMMSFAGGATVQGGLVAVLQSAGVIGFPIVVPVVAGGAAGYGVYRGFKYLISESDTQSDTQSESK